MSIKLNGIPLVSKFFSHNNIILKNDTIIKIDQGIYDFSNNVYDFRIYINEKYNLSIEEGEILKMVYQNLNY